MDCRSGAGRDFVVLGHVQDEDGPIWHGKASLTELRYGVRKISRPRVVLLCPGGRGMQNLDNRTAIGIGFRVNFAASAPHANVQLQHGGYQGAGLCFRVMQDLGPSLELLFLQQPALG